MPRVRDVVGLVIALTVAAGCVRLGAWQLDRLQQRRARNAQVRAARERPAVEARAGLPADSAASRRVHAPGRYDYAHQRLWRARSYEGVPGVALVTPLRLADGSAVFVDRGWAPSPDAAHVDERAYREPDTADVLGLGFRAPRGRGDVDPARLQDSLPYPVLPFVLQQLPPSTARPHPLASTPARRRSPSVLCHPMVLLRRDHPGRKRGSAWKIEGNGSRGYQFTLDLAIFLLRPAVALR